MLHLGEDKFKSYKYKLQSKKFVKLKVQIKHLQVSKTPDEDVTLPTT